LTAAWLLSTGCGGDDDGVGSFPDAGTDSLPDALVRFDAPVGSPLGGWSASDSLFACFTTSQSADFADSIAEVTANPCCYWDMNGLLYYPNGTGTWTIDGMGRLVITVDPPCGIDCGPVFYEASDSFDCAF
jgi:hypothetical protein